MDTADDLVQAACERALRQNKGWTPDDYIDRWMFRTIRNLHIDQLRRVKTTERFRGKVFDETPAMEDGSLALESSIRLDEVRNAMARLSEEQKSVLMLICVEGYSYCEVSEILDLPIGTVTSRLARGRTLVLETLEPNSRITADAKKVVDGS